VRLEKMRREDAKLLERIFFSYFVKKIKDGKAGWQTIGDALTLSLIIAGPHLIWAFIKVVWSLLNCLNGF
jgi:hypothetical protein